MSEVEGNQTVPVQVEFGEGVTLEFYGNIEALQEEPQSMDASGTVKTRARRILLHVREAGGTIQTEEGTSPLPVGSYSISGEGFQVHDET